MSSLRAQTRLIVRNDLRLFWRDLQSSRLKDYLSLGLVVVLFCLANAVGIGAFFVLRRQPPLAYENLAWLFFGLMMLATAMNQAIVVLFERADFDLLLPSPASARAILIARLATMTIGAALTVAIFLLPLLNGALLAVSWRYSSGYLVWLLLSCTAASVGVWFTLLLVEWLGPRRARVWTQVAAALLGASVYLALQSRQWLETHGSGKIVSQALQTLSRPPLTFVAQAGRGEPLPLLALAGTTAIFLGLTTRLLGRRFIGGVQDAGGSAPARGRRERRHVFSAGVFRATFQKDLRLILRDPLLLAQVLPSALYLLPPLLGVGRLGIGTLAPLTLIITGMFSASLSSVAAAGEEGWDLIRLSPTSELRLRLAKLAAGIALPVLLCLALCALLAALGRPGLALLTLLFSIGCAAACSWLHVTRVKPTPRHDVLKRGQRDNFGRGLAAGFFLMFAAAGLGFAAAGHGLTATLLLGVTTLLTLACFTLIRMEEIHLRDFTARDAP